jgi:hypothetical protein
MQRPDYVNGGDTPSIDTWQEACAISQEWADGARQAAGRRRFWFAVASLVLVILLIGGVVALILTDTVAL